MYHQYPAYIVDEVLATSLKGQWRQAAFTIQPKSFYTKKNISTHALLGKEKVIPSLREPGNQQSDKELEETRLDVEIGPGSGGHVLHLAKKHSKHFVVAIEMKYKPLIKLARKLQQMGLINAKLIRYNARLLNRIFFPQELNNVYIHFPDPWPKQRHTKHRLITTDFVHSLYNLQRKLSFVEIKTDHKEYFSTILRVFQESSYTLRNLSHNLHANSLLSRHNFITNFEKIFIAKSQPIYYVKYVKVK